MESSGQASRIIEHPLPFFSVREEFFLRATEMELTEPLGYLAEDVMVKIYVAAGQGFIHINGERFPLSPGTLCSLQSYHFFLLEPTGAMTIRALVLDYGLGNYLSVDPNMEQQRNYFDCCPVTLFSGWKKAECERLLASFAREAEIGDPSSPIIQASLWMQLEELEASEIFRKHWDPPLGWKILSHITKYNTSNLSAEAVASAFGLTKASLNRLLQRITTYSFSQLLTRARINGACAILPMRGISARYIANYLGFSTEKTFYDAFRAWKGMTPQEYRERFPAYVYGYVSDGIVELPYLVMTYICENYLRPITVKSAASELFVTEGQVNRAILAHTGCTFKQFLGQHRLRYAQALLCVTDLPIYDVAVESGFEASSTFCRVFKKATGMTAHEYRTKYGGVPYAAQ